MRRAWLILILAGIIVAGFIALIVWTVRAAPVRVVTLANGSRVGMLGTAMGNSPFTTETRWQRLARRILPRKWTGWIQPITAGSCSSGTNCITVYLHVTDAAGTSVSSTPWEGYATEDDTGFRYPREGGSCTTTTGTGTTIQGVILRAYPRRQSSFWLHLLDQTNGLMASLRIPNPARGRFPKWLPQPLPQTRTNGPVILTLENLGEGGSEPWRYVGAKWSLTSADPAWARARARSFTFVDATGNEGQWLSRREPAWRAQTRVYRERREDFGRAERMVLADLAIPVEGEFVEIDQTAEISGVKVTALLLAGPGSLFITNGISRAMIPSTTRAKGHSSSWNNNTNLETWEGQRPFLLIEVQNAQTGDELLIRLLDNHGREVQLEPGGGWEGNGTGGRIYRRDFTPPPDARFVTMEIILNQPLAFEFMVNPAAVQPAKP